MISTCFAQRSSPRFQLALSRSTTKGCSHHRRTIDSTDAQMMLLLHLSVANRTFLTENIEDLLILTPAIFRIVKRLQRSDLDLSNQS